MAKSDLLNFLKDINFMYNDCGMHDCVSKMLEDFEAEIRASAIDEFADKLKESLMKNYRHFITTDTDGFDWLTTDAVGTHIDEIAEQLKEE